MMHYIDFTTYEWFMTYSLAKGRTVFYLWRRPGHEKAAFLAHFAVSPRRRLGLRLIRALAYVEGHHKDNY